MGVTVNSTVTAVASSAANVTLLAANKRRKHYKIQNFSTQILYVKEGMTAGFTGTPSFSYPLNPGATYEAPDFGDDDVYNGIIDGIWVAANGYALVTEYF